MDTNNQTSSESGKLPIDVGNVDANGVSHLDTKVAPPTTTEARTETASGEKPAQAAQTVAPKTYSEDELNQRVASIKGGHEGTVKQMRAEMAKLKEQATQAAQAAEDARQSAWIEAIKQSGGDIDVATRIVERDRAVRATEARLAAREAELSEREATLNEAGRGKMAYDLIGQYGLDPKVVDVLLKTSDPRDMEIQALKLHAEKLKTTARPPETPDKGQGQKGLDISKLTIRQRLGMAAEGKI